MQSFTITHRFAAPREHVFRASAVREGWTDTLGRLAGAMSAVASARGGAR